MANTVTIEVKGLRELGVALKELGDEMHLKIARAATRKASILIRDNARSLAPVKTGELREGIQVRRLKRESYPGFEVWAVGVFKYSRQKQRHDPYYWKFVEFGTVKMSAQPFLRPGYDGEKTEAVEVMRNEIAAGIDRKTRSYK